MVALDPSDGSRQRPVDVATGVGCADQRDGLAVGLEGADRDARAVQVTGVELSGTVPSGSTRAGMSGSATARGPPAFGAGGGTSATPGTTIAAESFETAPLLSPAGPASAVRATPPPINASARTVAQALRQGSSIVRTRILFDMPSSLGASPAQPPVAEMSTASTPGRLASKAEIRGTSVTAATGFRPIGQIGSARDVVHFVVRRLSVRPRAHGRSDGPKQGVT
jgi:hypothetical protein